MVKIRISKEKFRSLKGGIYKTSKDQAKKIRQRERKQEERARKKKRY